MMRNKVEMIAQIVDGVLVISFLGFELRKRISRQLFIGVDYGKELRQVLTYKSPGSINGMFLIQHEVPISRWRKWHNRVQTR